MQHSLRISIHGLLQNRRERRARVLDITVDAARNQRLVADVAAGKIETPFHLQARLRFDLLRE